MGSIAGYIGSFELSPGPALLAFALSRQAGMPEVGTETRQEWDPLPITGQVRATGDPITDPYQTCSNASDTMRLEFCPAARAEESVGSKGASPLVSLADLSVDWAERFFALIPLRHVLSKQICRREWRGPHVRRAQGHLAAEQCRQALKSQPLDAAKTRGLMGRSHGTPGRGKNPMCTMQCQAATVS